MRKAIVSLAVAAMLTGPMGALASANPIQYIKNNGIPENSCEWQEALGIVNVKACEDPEDW